MVLSNYLKKWFDRLTTNGWGFLVPFVLSSDFIESLDEVGLVEGHSPSKSSVSR